MTKDVLSPAVDFYNKYIEHQNAMRARETEDEQRRNQVRKIFAQGSYLANEYGKTPHFIDGHFVVITHPATLKVGDREVQVVVKAEAAEVNNKNRDLPFEHYTDVSVYPAERIRLIDTDHSEAIFHINYSSLTTQTTGENDPGAIEAANLLMGAIEVDLHENQTARSQMPQLTKPKKERGRISKILLG